MASRRAKALQCDEMTNRYVKPHISGIILAGGQSRRMGADKAALPLLGKPLAAWVLASLQSLLDEVWLVGGSSRLADELGIGFAPDLLPGAGPLAGIYSGLRATGGDVMVSACDTPLLQPRLLQAILAAADGYDVAVPVNGGECEPLVGLYRRTCLQAMEDALSAEARQVRSIYDAVRVHIVPESIWRQTDPHGLSFINVNSPVDLVLAQEMMESEATWKIPAVSSSAS